MRIFTESRPAFASFARFLARFLASSIFGVSAIAETFKGTVQNFGPQSPLKLTILAPGQSIDGRLVNLLVQGTLGNFLHHLHTGDSITAQGSLDGSQRNLSIDSVDEVGLQQLLGSWRTNRWEVFEFQNFNLLNLYVPTATGAGEVNLAKTHALKYILTPEQDANRFSIFMSDDRDVRMGFLEVSESKLILTVTDFKTGQVSDTISLQPVHF